MVDAITSNTILNRAINLIGSNQAPVVGEWPSFDDSAAGVAANKLYDGVVKTVGRSFGCDFNRNIATLQDSGAYSGPPGLAKQYLYPTTGIQVRQVFPPAPDPNDPLPYTWLVGNATVAGAPAKVIWTNIVAAQAAITNQPPENLWDSIFTEEVVRMLASELAQAVSGKPETAKDNLDSSQQFGTLGASRDS